MKRRITCVLALAAGLALAPPVQAKRNNPNVSLEFRPQQAVGAAVASVSGAMLDRPATLEFMDRRRGEDPLRIGVRTDDDDRRHELRATSDVAEYVEKQFVESAADWGIELEDGEPVILAIELLEVDLLETNQAVGATYNATVRLGYSLRTRGGEERASASATGDATRYGKKFSNDNLNEVLSDAMLEAFAAVFSDAALQRAWAE